MPADAAFAAFLAKVPDAPSSAAPSHEEPPPDPKADAPGAEGDAEAQTPAPSKESADGANVPSVDAKTPSQSPDLESVRAALARGDLDAVADLLGEDPAHYDEKTTKWAARQRREQKIRDERDSTRRKAEAVVTRWKPVADAVAELPTAPERLLDLVASLTGQDPEAAWTAAIRARGPVDPRVPVVTRRAEEAEAELERLRGVAAEAADRAFFETLRDEVDTKHTVRQIDEWERKVAEVLRESVDPELGESKLSTKQAADRVVRREREAFEKMAKAFGVAPAAKPARGRSPERAAGATGAPVRKMTRDEWLAARSRG